MNLKYLQEDKLIYLNANVRTNIINRNYFKKESWIQDWLEPECVLDSGKKVSDITLIIPKKSGTETDFENCKKLYIGLKDLTLEQASDDRLWTYLTHVTFWEYMIKRWPLEDKADDKIDNFIKERYFLRKNSDRSLLRNGLSKLWWIGYTTYDEKRKDPFEITKFLLSDTDLQSGLMDRSISRNKDFTKNILLSLMDYSKTYGFPSRSKRRYLWKYINRLGGVKVLDMLDYAEINSIILDVLK